MQLLDNAKNNIKKERKKINYSAASQQCIWPKQRQKYNDPEHKYVQEWTTQNPVKKENKRERGLTMRLSKSSWSDGRGQGGRTGRWLAVRVLMDYRGVQLYDPGGM
jgi:hypothetical protein